MSFSRPSSPRPRAAHLTRRAAALCVAASLFTAQAASQTPPKDAVCRMCHAVHTSAESPKPAPGERIAHRALACVDCHSALRTFDPSDGDHDRPLAKVDCGACHAAESAALESSVHAALADECARCHAPHDIGIAKGDGAADTADSLRRACSACHANAAAHWAKSVHAKNPGNGRVAAECSDCHGAHDVRGARDPQSRVNPLALPDTCESCHRPHPSDAHPAPAGEKARQYETSVHGVALRTKGLIVTATCASCHGAHEILEVQSDGAPTSRLRIPYTCGECHAGILRSYLGGVHGEAFAKGSRDVPVCIDCHREHGVQDPSSPTSSVSSELVAETCARCHGDETLARRYGIKANAWSSWGASYHGIAKSFGDTAAANCASCHGFHDIFPSKDPRSRVNLANLDQTCGNCHVNAGAAFARVPVHAVVDSAANPVPWWVKRIYAALVAVMIAGFVVFILIDLFGRLRVRCKWGPPETVHVDPRRWPDEERLIAPDETFARMGRMARLQHAVLITSFVLLVLTGIPVFLHQASFMRSLIDLEGGFALRSRLHRIGAVGLIVLSAWHVAILALSPDARRWFAKMWLRPRDVIEFAEDALFSLGIGAWLAKRRGLQGFFERHPRLRFDRRPRAGRYGLVEKLEYGAVLWGNLVMIATGAILWRPDWFLDWMPSWTFEVCRVVHGFEATLAFLAIIVWHMYHVHLRPGVFPMSRVWLTGRISRDELRHHHPDEYLRILEHRRANARRLFATEERHASVES